MTAQERALSRRGFLKVAGMAGVGSLLAARELFGAKTETAPATKPAEKQSPLPMRDFGKTGVKVPILALGGIFNTGGNQLLLKQAVKWGVTYWDTAEDYGRGKSESGMGQYFESNSEDRKKVFLVSKSRSHSRAAMTERLERSLDRLKTDYVDMYCIHQISSPAVLTDEVKAWVQETKKAKKIRFFGFSTHGNMDQCLLGAAKLGWIDGLMTTYNFRLVEKMKPALEACAKAGVGVTAMKTQGNGPKHTATDTEMKLLQQFLDKGFTPEQARLKAVWETPHVATICSQMPNLTILMSNLAAAMDKTKLTEEDEKLLARYASETCSDYCAGCTEICESAVAGAVPIGDVMRCLMYYHSYDDRDLAREVFGQLPRPARRRLASVDYSDAQRRCPQGIPIGKLMKEASDLLT